MLSVAGQAAGDPDRQATGMHARGWILHPFLSHSTHPNSSHALHPQNGHVARAAGGGGGRRRVDPDADPRQQ